MSLTMSPATRRIVEAALLAKGARYVNRVSDTETRDSVSATLKARAAADARMAGIARTHAELEALLLQYPAGYLHRIDMAFTLSKRAKAVRSAFRRHANRVGFTPSDVRLRRLALLHSKLASMAAPYWQTPAAPIDLDATNPHNRFMRKVHANMAGKWSSLTWAAVEPSDIFQTAVELAVRENRTPTIGNLYRALNRAYSMERRIAFGTRGPGFVTVDDVSELDYNRAFEAQVERLETMGRILLTPETLLSESFVDLTGQTVKSGAHYATRLESHRAVHAAKWEQEAAVAAAAKRAETRRVQLALKLSEQTETDASAQYGGSIVALLLEGNTLADIAEFFGLTVETVTRYALSTRDSVTATDWVMVETTADRMRIIGEFPDKASARRSLEAMPLPRAGHAYSITERTPEPTEPEATPNRAHWKRNRQPVPALGHAADKFAGCAVHVEPIPEAQPWSVTA